MKGLVHDNFLKGRKNTFPGNRSVHIAQKVKHIGPHRSQGDFCALRCKKRDLRSSEDAEAVIVQVHRTPAREMDLGRIKLSTIEQQTRSRNTQNSLPFLFTLRPTRGGAKKQDQRQHTSDNTTRRSAEEENAEKANEKTRSWRVS